MARQNVIDECRNNALFLLKIGHLLSLRKDNH